MELTIMFNDKSIKKIPVQRVMTIDTPGGQHLYYELSADIHGSGHHIPVCDLICWEANAIIIGGSQNLKL